MTQPFEEKRRLARALFQQATGYEPEGNDWSHMTERNLDVLIHLFRGMIVNDPATLRLIRDAICVGGK